MSQDGAREGPLAHAAGHDINYLALQACFGYVQAAPLLAPFFGSKDGKPKGPTKQWGIERRTRPKSSELERPCWHRGRELGAFQSVLADRVRRPSSLAAAQSRRRFRRGRNVADGWNTGGALRVKQIGPQAKIVDAAMVDHAATLGAMVFGMIGSGTWRAEREANVVDGGAPFYGVYETADGEWVSIGSIGPQFYAELLAPP